MQAFWNAQRILISTLWKTADERGQAWQITLALGSNEKAKLNPGSKTEGPFVFLGTSVQGRYSFCCQNHIKWGVVKLSASDKGSARLSGFRSAGLNFWHTAHFHLFILSFLPVTPQGQPQICSHAVDIMQGTSAFSKKRWYQRKPRVKMEKNRKEKKTLQKTRPAYDSRV